MRAIKQWNKMAIGALAIIAVGAFAASASTPYGRYTLTTSTVLDSGAHLRWTRYPSSSTYLQLSDAQAYCSNLGNLDGYAGWTVPTKIQIETLFDFGSDGGVLLDTTVFPTITSSVWFWIYSANTGENSYILSFAGTEEAYSIFLSPQAYTLCVQPG